MNISLEQLLEAGVHFGHQVRRWNPKMKPYLYGARDGVHIFDLAKTKQGLEEAYKFVRDLVAGDGTIVFVGTKRQARSIVVEEAERAGVPYVSERWLGGTITNWEQIKKSTTNLSKMKEKRSAGEYKEFTKKEQLLLNREIGRLERFFGGLSGLTTLPDAIFVVDTHKEAAAVKEAVKKGITVVGLVDSNSDPFLVDYVIPGNDDAVRAIKIVVAAMAEAVIEGKKKVKK